MSSEFWTGNREYFPGIPRIEYEGPESDNPLAFKAYDADRMVGNKTMREHLRFSICYWHTFCADGADPFGPGTRRLPWNESTDPLDAAKQRLDAAFEFFSKMTVPYFCFHDRDLAPEGGSVRESEENLQQLVGMTKARQQETGIQLLWGTANVFSHPRYMNGASTNPDFNVVAHAGAQVKAALDATVELGGSNYVFWGGREGYASLFNTDTRRELDHLARFLTLARDYGRSIGFQGTFLIEPKPMEPMYHQYDVDAQTVIGFLRQYGLADDFKVNVEANHATLAGHSFAHELRMCADAGMLGSIDANRGNPQNGWDTDQFPSDLYDTIQAMLVVLEDGGFTSGGLNFDAKVRRESTDPEDLFMAHIGGMDSFARGLLIAHEILEKSSLADYRRERYSSFDSGPGQAFAEGRLSLEDLREHASNHGEPRMQSGRQEWVENIMNDFIFRVKH
ncbi:MAG: xylose isomerase [Halieaceae bacterium]|jgi:xylose isomerase|nr:xylose isomerase [Halieaceae bacterium]